MITCKCNYEIMKAYPNGKVKLRDAITIFKLNTELFSKEANAWDSLGEAYLKSGDKQSAMINYKKALEVDPNFPSAKKALKEIERK